MGPSRKDQRGPCLFFSFSFSNAAISSQKRRTERSRAGKSARESTLSNGMTSPRVQDANKEHLSEDRPRQADVRGLGGAGNAWVFIDRSAGGPALKGRSTNPSPVNGARDTAAPGKGPLQ